MRSVARWSFVAVVLAGVGGGVWALNHNFGPTGAVLDDPAGRVAAVRWVQDPGFAQPTISVPDGTSAPWPLPVSDGHDGWDTRIAYLGGTCETGVRVTVPAGDGPLRVDGFHSGPPGRGCDGMGATHGVDIRWVEGKEPADVTAEQPRG